MTTSLEDRIDAKTTSQNKWNGWPDMLEIVAIKRYDLKDARSAYEAGKLLGHYSAYRQIMPNQLPTALRAIVPIQHPMLMTHFVMAHPAGQDDDEATRNIYAIFELFDHTRGIGPQELIRVEIGCKHDYDTTGSRMCLSRGKCRRCGHTFTCDSGD